MSASNKKGLKKKRYLTVTERRLLKNFRRIELAMILIILTEPLGYFVFNAFPPQSRINVVSAFLSIGVMVMFSMAIVYMEKNEIRQIKNGEFMKRMKRTARQPHNVRR